MKEIFQVVVSATAKITFNSKGGKYPVRTFAYHPDPEEIQEAVKQWNEKDNWVVHYAKVECRYLFD